MSENEPVGYRRPPVSGQFKPGQSGNPSGRPKRGPSFGAELDAFMSELTTGADGKIITNQRALIERMRDLAMGGHARALYQFVAMLARRPEPEADTAEELADRDQEIPDTSSAGEPDERKDDAPIATDNEAK